MDRESGWPQGAPRDVRTEGRAEERLAGCDQGGGCPSKQGKHVSRREPSGDQ